MINNWVNTNAIKSFENKRNVEVGNSWKCSKKGILLSNGLD